ncbi:MAG: peptidase M55 [Candidatus Aminicenantes bacterium]|nr:peptidase M55 [Candidatus Aminicenantes bacterium]NIM78894.1 peptidase M55 [Candidatus Aminicenantes bacterium]NIN18150.1 peptidase M55 [Candidatus Aminicenantes bacterium]NIN42049.1 peptidase M55 [Candidatus Aminicenantes bacterium]NIN84805.1 peptidase M55 [Candidatus Aminicenantes bacterium]
MIRKKIWLFFVIFAVFSYLQAGDKAPLKVFISVDMEGIWGVVHYNQTSSSSSGYGAARKWMVEDVNAVVAGLLEAGATEIVVNDSHGSMRNIIADDLHPKASLISGSPKPLVMMQGIDDSFAACIFIGYHAKAGSASAVLDHTISGGSVRAIKINGIELPELGLNAAIAGYFKVPVIMISGDTETCRQAKSILGNKIVTVAVKEGIGRYAAKLLPPEEARRQLKEKAKEALLKKDKISPFKLNPPLSIELELHRSSQAEMPLLVPQVKLINPRTVGFSSNDYLEAFKLLRALIALASRS